MQLLGFNPYFDPFLEWKQNTVSIFRIDPLWSNRSFISKVLRLLKLAKQFDAFIFYRETRLPTIFGLVRKIFRMRVVLILQELYIDIGLYHFPRTLHPRIAGSLLMYKILGRVMDVLVVHSAAEINLYSHFLKV